MSRSKLVLFVCVAGGVAAAIAVLVVVRERRSAPAESVIRSVDDWNAALRDRPAPSAGYEMWDEAKFQARLSTTIEVRAEDLGLSPADAGRLKRAAGEALAAYWTADVRRYVELLKSQNLVPRAQLTDPRADELMLSLTRSVAGSHVDLEHLDVILWAREGVPLSPQRKSRPGVYATWLAEPRGAGDVIDPARSKTDVVAVSVPTELLNIVNGKPFQGTFTVYLTRRAADGEWLVIRVETHNPTGPYGPDQPKTMLPPL